MKTGVMAMASYGTTFLLGLVLGGLGGSCYRQGKLTEAQRLWQATTDSLVSAEVKRHEALRDRERWVSDSLQAAEREGWSRERARWLTIETQARKDVATAWAAVQAAPTLAACQAAAGQLQTACTVALAAKDEAAVIATKLHGQDSTALVTARADIVYWRTKTDTLRLQLAAAPLVGIEPKWFGFLPVPVMMAGVGCSVVTRAQCGLTVGAGFPIHLPRRKKAP